MDRESGPFGTKKQFSYQEVLRNIQQQPYDIKVPPRTGLRRWDDPFYQNLIQGQGAYLGDVARSGFSHEAPYTPPPRDEVFYDARSDFGDFSEAASGNGRPPPQPPGNLGIFAQLYGDDGSQSFQPDDTQGGHWNFLPPPPPPPPGNLGVFSALYGQRAGNQPIQSGFMAPFPAAPPAQIPLYPQPTRNFLEQEGIELPPEPVQPGFFQQVSQSIRDGARSAALERAGQFGAALGAGAANVGGQVLRGVGGAIRDGAVRAFDWDRGYLWRAADEAGNVILNPNSWRQNTNIEFLRRGAPALQDAEALLANEAAAGEALGIGLGMAAEGAEVGLLGGPAGAIAGASMGAVAGALLAFRARDAPEREDHFLDARSVNGGNESARPLRSRFDLALDQRQRNPQPLRPRLERHVPGSEQTPTYYRMDTPTPSPPWSENDEAPGRQQDVLRPTSAPRPQQQRRSVQDIVDGIAAAQPRGPESIRPVRRTPGDRNRMPPSQPAGSSQDIMRPTTAPMAHGLNAAPSLPQPSRRRNRAAS